MADSREKIQIRFEAKGDKALEEAIRRLAKATRDFSNAQRKLNRTSKDTAKSTGLVNMRVERNTKVFQNLMPKLGFLQGSFAIISCFCINIS